MLPHMKLRWITFSVSFIVACGGIGLTLSVHQGANSTHPATTMANSGDALEHALTSSDNASSPSRIDRANSESSNDDSHGRLSTEEAALLDTLRQLAARRDATLPTMVSLGAFQWSSALTPDIAQLLADMESPEAIQALLAELAAEPDGELKETIGRIVDNMDASAFQPLLLQALLESDDPGVTRSVQTALSGAADESLIYDVARRVLETESDHERDVSLDLISSTRSREAVPALIFLADAMAVDLEAPLAHAAIRGLASTGAPEAISYLIASLDVSTPEAATPYRDAILSISAPEAMQMLEIAALGNKESTQSSTRAAAILALVNSPTDGTPGLLQSLLTGEDSEVAAAAKRALVSLGLMNEEDPLPDAQVRID